MSALLRPLPEYGVIFDRYLSNHPLIKQPVNLYEPADYILSLGGKRLRPAMALAIAELFGGEDSIAMKVGMALEVFHNFTLVHDDIMDESIVRRGQPTVHVKYGNNIAILSGDAMMIRAYQYILDIHDAIMVKSLLDTFNKMAIEVCEGQQMDIDFENRSDVEITDYIEMIRLKTSVLIAAAAQMGAIVGNASLENQKHMYDFALNFGIAFQLQDDILDTFGDGHLVGKRIGGDILNNKKTYLYLKSLDLASPTQKSQLESFYATKDNHDEEDKIIQVKKIFDDLLVKEYAIQVIEAYRDLSLSHLDACTISDENRSVIKDFVNEFIYRKY